MKKEQRVLVDPLSLRFEDSSELWNSFGKVQKVVFLALSPVLIFPIAFYMGLCELECAFK